MRSGKRAGFHEIMLRRDPEDPNEKGTKGT